MRSQSVYISGTFGVNAKEVVTVGETVGETGLTILGMLFLVGWIVWTVLLFAIPIFIWEIRKDVHAIAKKLGAVPRPAKPARPPEPIEASEDQKARQGLVERHTDAKARKKEDTIAGIHRNIPRE